MARSSDSACKRTRILTSTLEVLARQGFHGFSMKQLADEAGVATGTIYLYFQDKEALIESLHLELIQRIAAELFFQHDPLAPANAQFALFARNYWRYCMSEKNVVLSKAQFDHLPPEVLDSQRQDARRIFAPLLAYFEQCRANRILKDLPDEVLISLGIEPLLHLAAKAHLGRAVVDPPLFEKVLAACWDAIATSGSGALEV